MMRTDDTLRVRVDFDNWLHLPRTVAAGSADSGVEPREVFGQVCETIRAQRMRRGRDISDSQVDLLATRCIAVPAESAELEVFLATELPALDPVLAVLSLTPQVREDSDYLVGWAGGRDGGAVRPVTIEPLPSQLGEGCTVLRCDEGPDGSLVASLTIARRAWGHDIIAAVRTKELGVVPDVIPALFELVASMEPTTEVSA